MRLQIVTILREQVNPAFRQLVEEALWCAVALTQVGQLGVVVGEGQLDQVLVHLECHTMGIKKNGTLGAILECHRWHRHWLQFSSSTPGLTRCQATPYHPSPSSTPTPHTGNPSTCSEYTRSAPVSPLSTPPSSPLGRTPALCRRAEWSTCWLRSRIGRIAGWIGRRWGGRRWAAVGIVIGRVTLLGRFGA